MKIQHIKNFCTQIIANTVQKGNYIALNAYIRKENSQFSNLNLHLKELEKE